MSRSARRRECGISVASPATRTRTTPDRWSARESPARASTARAAGCRRRGRSSRRRTAGRRRVKVMGKPCTDVASRVCHRTLPVVTSIALNVRSRSPTNATSPAVDSTAVRNGARCWIAHFSFMRVDVEGARACRCCRRCPASRRSADRRRRRCRRPAFCSMRCARIAMQLWLSGMIERVGRLRWWLIACQLWPPSVLGQPSIHWPTSASMMSWR